MANLKIIWTTGSPFSSSCVNKIGYQISPDKFNIYTGSYWSDQASYTGQGYRPATAREIAEHWDVLHPMWIPEVGDKVIITQDHDDWRNKRAVIVERHYYEDYCRIKKEDGGSTIFSKSIHMILAPYEETAKPLETPKSMFGFTVGDIVIPECSPFLGKRCIVKAFNVSSESVGVYCPSAPASEAGHNLEGRLESGQKGWWHNKNRLKLASKEEPETVSKSSTPSTPSIPLPKEGYVTIRFFTEEEFRSKGLWSVFEGQGYPKGWNINGEMNKYLGTYLQTREPGFTSDKSLDYGGWTFKDTDYEVIHEGVETKPEPKEPEMKAQKFKVGDQVTYKSKSSCDGYKYGGDNHDGYVGTITSYGVYKPEYDCYGIHVTCKEGGNYSMLESEFYEYDGIHPKVITSATSLVTDVCTIAPGTANTTSIPLDTWGIHIHKTSSELKEEDALAKYDQAPVTLQKKPKTKLITVNTY
jgi:hypothetical protein